MRNFIHAFFVFLVLFNFTPAFADKKLDDSLVYYITIGRLEDIQSLLEKGANPNAVDKIGVSVLALACERVDSESFAVVKVLVEKGAEINVKDEPKNNPLIVAIKNNNPKFVRYFLEQGADFHVRDSDGSGTREIAMLYAGDEVQWLVNEAFNIENERKAKTLTKEAFNNALQKYSFYNCTHQYMTYFKLSGQEKIWNESLYKKSLDKQLELISYYGNKLFADFYLSGGNVETISQISRSSIVKELDSFVSNEGRREAGVGSNEDIKTRCSKIAKQWNSERFVDADKDISDLENIRDENGDEIEINLERNE